MDKETDSANKQVHLFTLRIWAVGKGETAPQWRSRLQNVQSGDVFFCDDLPSLLARIEDALSESYADCKIEMD